MAERQSEEYDIVIAGAGMVGASLACLLGRESLRIALVDRQPLSEASAPLSPTKFEPRVSAISRASQELFKELGVWEGIEAQRACHYRDMEVWDAEGTGSISFSAAEINEDELGSIIENSIITEALHQQIVKLENVTVITPFSIESFDYSGEGGDQIIRLQSSEGESISACLVVAADGANSRLRQLGNFECKEWDYEQHALVTTVQTEKQHARTALQRFLESGPLAFLPLSATQRDDEQRYCSIVWSMMPEQAERAMGLSASEFNKELGAAIEFRLGKITGSAQRFVFPLRQRHALDYVKDNLVLVGDAAHTIHPLAGQGVNLGFQDAKALAEELIRAVEAGRRVSDPTVLQRYQRRRKGSNLSMMWLMEGFKRLFAQQDLGIRWLRNVGMNAADKMTPIKNQMIRKAMGLEN